MKKYIAIGVIAFAVSLLIFIPASAASRLLPDHIVGENFNGNLWHGSAAAVRSAVDASE